MQMKFMYFFFLFGLPLASFAQALGLSGNSQNLYLSDMRGNPIMTQAYMDITGSPYLPAKWQEGMVLLKTGQKYDSISIRYNVYDDNVEYNYRGDAFFFKKGMVREFHFKMKEENSLKLRVFRCGFENTEKNTGNTYYEVLYDGKYKLLKDHFVSIIEIKMYNSASIEKKFQSEEFLYIALPSGLPVRIKKNKKSLLEAINNPKLEKWLDSQKNKCRNEAQIIETMKFLESE